MKSIETLLPSIIDEPKERNKLALKQRNAPLMQEDIEKIELAIGKHFECNEEDVYGYIPVLDEAGNKYKTEWGMVTKSKIFNKKETTPHNLIDAMNRPASNRTTIYHLTRLATHLKDTRGKEALQAVIEDLSVDLSGYSEWAIIEVCRYFRQTRKWYPSSSEIIKAVKDQQDKIAYGCSQEKTEEKQCVIEKINYRRKICDYLIEQGEEDFYDKEHWYSVYQLERLAKAKHGWKSYD